MESYTSVACAHDTARSMRSMSVETRSQRGWRGSAVGLGSLAGVENDAVGSCRISPRSHGMTAVKRSCAEQARARLDLYRASTTRSFQTSPLSRYCMDATTLVKFHSIFHDARCSLGHACLPVEGTLKQPGFSALRTHRDLLGQHFDEAPMRSRLSDHVKTAS